MGRQSRAKAERRRVRLARPEIEAHLESHLRWLSSSARAYDEGFEDEARRLAVSIRAICHETERSHSLLKQLDLARSMAFTDTANHIDSANLADTWGLVIMEITAGVGVTFVPPLASLSPSRQHPPASFTAWWNNQVVKAQHITWSRKTLVLALANQDGGAHVDPSLDEGVYVQFPGPHYETPSEVVMARRIGGDLVGIDRGHPQERAGAGGAAQAV